MSIDEINDQIYYRDRTLGLIAYKAIFLAFILLKIKKYKEIIEINNHSTSKKKINKQLNPNKKKRNKSACSNNKGLPDLLLLNYY